MPAIPPTVIADALTARLVKGLSTGFMVPWARNSFQAAFLDEPRRQQLLAELEAYTA